MTASSNFELVALKNGVMSLRALQPRETFHPGIGPVAEATLLHVQQQNLVKRCQLLCAQGERECNLWDVGLGAGANALAALRTFAAWDDSEVPGMPTDGGKFQITVHSFDKSTEPLEFALQNAQSLHYPLGFESQLRALLSHGLVEIFSNSFLQVNWQLHLGDFARNLDSQVEGSLALSPPDSIFFDPYSPAGNPDMWSLQLFTKLYGALSSQRPCLWTNYSRATPVRATLLLAGFFVGHGCSINEKDETTVASNSLNLIDRPLTLEWLEKRVRVSHSAAVLRDGNYSIAPISESDYAALLAHPQFRV